MSERLDTTCLEIDPLLAEYAEGGLAEAGRSLVQAHLSQCAGCRELAADMESSLVFSRAARALAPPARASCNDLVARILEQTTGRLSWKQRLRLWVWPVFEPRLAMGLAMAILSFSIVLRALDVDVSNVTMADLTPVSIYRQLDRRVHLAGTRVAKYYRDLRIVYEIQTQLQAIRDDATPEKKPEPKAEPPQPERRSQPQGPAQKNFSGHQPLLAGALLF